MDGHLSESAATLAGALMSLPQGESGGIVASDRFDYQKDWTLCKLLELHESGTDYVVICEFHEDVSIVDHHSDPTKVTFYQIKTDDSKKWTVARLVRRSAGKKGLLPSILGKLCGKQLSVDSCTVLYRFTSNARYMIRSEDGSSLEASDVFTLAQIHKNELKKLIDALSGELKEPLPSGLLASVQLEVGLALKSHSDITTGKLATFVEKYAPGCSIHVSAFYRAILDEIRRRTSAPRPTSSFSDVCQLKGISRMAFDKMLSDAVQSVPSDRTWSLVMQELTAQGTPLAVRADLDRGFRKYFIRQLNPEDLSLKGLRKRVVASSAGVLTSSPTISLMQLAESVHVQVASSQEFVSANLKKNEFLAMVMVEVYEGQEPEVSPISAQPPKAQS